MVFSLCCHTVGRTHGIAARVYSDSGLESFVRAGGRAACAILSADLGRLAVGRAPGDAGLRAAQRPVSDLRHSHGAGGVRRWPRAYHAPAATVDWRGLSVDADVACGHAPRGQLEQRPDAEKAFLVEWDGTANVEQFASLVGRDRISGSTVKRSPRRDRWMGLLVSYPLARWSRIDEMLRVLRFGAEERI
jgi:hypothetical protein